MNDAFEGTRDAEASGCDIFGRYERWNSAIAAHFFTLDYAQQPVRLAFDDEAAATIGRVFDEGVDDLSRCLTQLVQPHEGDNAFDLLTHGGGDAYSRLALLAVQVLAASRMGEDPTADVKTYWKIFFGLIGTDLTQRQIEHLTPFWFDCERFYREEQHGAIGLLSLPANPAETPLSGKRHINLPLWQCTLREADREQLRRRFQIASADDLRIAPDHLPALARTWPELNRTLANTLRWAADNPDFEHQLGRLLDDVRVTARNTAYVSEGRRHVASRLRLVGLRKQSCYLQTRSASGQWLDVGPGGDASPLTAEQILYGVDADAFGGSWVGSNRLAFLKGNDGYTLLRGGINGAADVIVLYHTSAAPPDALSEGWRECTLDAEIRDEFVAFEGRFEPERDESLARMFGVDMLRQRDIALEGGLPIGRHTDGVYIRGAPPRVRIVRNVGTAILVGATQIEVAGRTIVPLPASLSGTETIRYGDDVVTIEMRDIPETENDDGSYLGWVLDQRGTMRVDDADVCEQVVLVGAELRPC